MLSIYLSTKSLKKYLYWLDAALVVIAMLIGVDIVKASVQYKSPKSKVQSPKPNIAQSTSDKGHRMLEPETQPFEHYSIIVERNLFGGGTEESEQKVDVESLPQTTLKLALKGTIIGGILYPRAIIENLSNKKQKVYRLGDVIEGAKIIEIQRDRVVLKEGDEISVLLTYEGGGQLTGYQVIGLSGDQVIGLSGDLGRIVKIGKNRWRVYRRDLWEAEKDRLRLLAQVRISPYLEKDRLAGFRISDIDEVSIINQLGIKDGDVIEKVNGERIGSIAKAWEVYEGVKDELLIKVDVKRGEEMVSLNYEILD